VSAVEEVPLFPLHTVLFPGGLLPLHIFEERYRLLVRERRDFGVVLIRHGREVGPGQGDDVHRVGTMATLQEVQELPDGRFLVVVRGLRRVRVLELGRHRPYLVARVETLEDPTAQPSPRLLHLFERYLAAHGVATSPRLSPELGGRVVWLVGSVLQAELAKRQRLLEEADPALAEAMLEEELTKVSNLGRLGSVPPRPPAPN
jgi:ATP-dependent Lon protease